MISMKTIEEQLKRIGCNFRVWGRSEIRELCNVLMPEEQVIQAVNGSYEGGFAMLCVTQYRVLLVDRKPMLLTIEDIRYDMVAEVDFNNRVMNATIRIFTPLRNLEFSSWSQHRMRNAVNYIQQRVMEIRQQGVMQSTQPQVQVPQSSPATAMTGSRTGLFTHVARMPMNPYTHMPLFSNRRRFPNYY